MLGHIRRHKSGHGKGHNARRCEANTQRQPAVFYEKRIHGAGKGDAGCADTENRIAEAERVKHQQRAAHKREDGQKKPVTKQANGSDASQAVAVNQATHKGGQQHHHHHGYGLLQPDFSPCPAKLFLPWAYPNTR